ncbi:ThuA domain-containing protein [Streptomyces fuscichromogenes]|uniref:Glycosyl hydrolase n=1 Tax=Streptomyces fuscichromogenes TaxID=1324013 RepID=A0A917UIE9_9ACTN|nr:ThuA domain-containing protein [Streptomyces fuscichromogenes]GGM96795.1 glycosyl hydrolase [Streptomyces fuscichromogenes]
MRTRLRMRPLHAALTSAATTLGITVALVATGTLSVAQDRTGQGAQELGDPDYGVCRGVDARCYHDWGNFDTTKGYKVLLYTHTAGPRHANLGPALATGMNPPLTDANVVQNALLELGADNSFQVDYTEDVTQLASPATLFKYNAVIFYSTSRDALDDAAQTSLRQYIRGGGGFVGVHNAFGTEYNWSWYEGLLGNANFYDHGPEQSGTVDTVDRKDVSTRSLPATWSFTDEWYNLIPAPTRVRVLADVDESTLAKGVTGNYHHPGHGRNHPVAWCQYYDGGRAWLTTLGHDAKDFSTDGSFAGAAEFQKLLLGGIESAMGRTPFCT